MSNGILRPRFTSITPVLSRPAGCPGSGGADWADDFRPARTSLPAYDCPRAHRLAGPHWWLAPKRVRSTRVSDLTPLRVGDAVEPAVPTRRMLSLRQGGDGCATRDEEPRSSTEGVERSALPSLGPSLARGPASSSRDAHWRPSRRWPSKSRTQAEPLARRASTRGISAPLRSISTPSPSAAAALMFPSTPPGSAGTWAHQSSICRLMTSSSRSQTE
jgi:hypothetical protein